MLPQKYCKIWYDETEKHISHPDGGAAVGFGGRAAQTFHCGREK